MAEMFKLEIVTPERVFYEGDASMVELSTTEGDIGVYANHIPMTAIVAPGVLKIHEAGGVKRAALHAGFIEVLPEMITIMAEVVEWPDEIDVKRAEDARVRAERRLKDNKAECDTLRAKLALRRALTRLSARQ
ncbi:MAG: ATP synthase F1 subunit epsilon [Hungatella sp.]|nr:ATP synthase F1 subunit epsilon [Hungatella sp.]